MKDCFYNWNARIGFVLFLILIVFMSFRFTSEIMVLQPRYLMSQWENGNRQFSDRDWQLAVDDMESAIKIDSNNPEYIFDLARLYEWQANQKGVWTEHAKKYRSHSISNFQKCTRLSPIWAEAWANLAITKMLNQEFDSEVVAALENSMTYGKWEYGVHKKIIWLGISSWSLIPEAMQDKVLLYVKLSLTHDRSVGFINEVANRFKWDQLQVIKKSMRNEAL